MREIGGGQIEAGEVDVGEIGPREVAGEIAANRRSRGAF